MPENASVLDALNSLTSHFLPSDRLVVATALGIPPDSESETLQPIVFLNPGAPACEEVGVLKVATSLATPFVPAILRCGPFEGLATPGSAIAPLDTSRFNIPPVSAGTFGARVVAGSDQHLLSANHVLAHNGRTPLGTGIFSPGPIDVVGGGARIADYSNCVRLTSGVNLVDCAWAKLNSANVIATPPATDRVTAVSATIGMPVAKPGRTSGPTTSHIRFPIWHGHVDFAFGTFYFMDQAATWDSAGTTLPFAVPGDSGSLVLQQGAPTKGIGLVYARGYAYAANEFLGYIILICPLDQIVNQMGLGGTVYAT
jgi:hypothetical protein